MPDGVSAFRLERPLNLGEVLDRAFSNLVSSWTTVLGLIVVAFLPRAILHYYLSSLWLGEFGANLHKSPSEPIFTQALATNAQRSTIYVGSLGVTSSVAFDILVLLMVAACTVVVTEASEGRTIGALGALKYVGERWEVLAPVIAVLVLALFGVREAVSLSTRAYVGIAAQGGQYAAYILYLAPVWSIVTSWVGTSVLIVAMGVVTASLESESFVESIAWGLGGMVGKGRIGLTLFMGAALTILYFVASYLSLGGVILLDLTGSALLDTIWYVMIYALPLAFLTLSAIWFYLDWEFRSSHRVPT